VSKPFKSYLIVGLIAILPLWITYFIILAVFNVVVSLARPFIGALPFLPDSPLLVNMLSFLGTILFLFGLGVFMTNVVGRKIFLMFEANLQRIPVLSGIYTSIRKLINVFYDEGPMTKRFERVVLVEFPRKGVFSLGFVTSEGGPTLAKRIGKDVLTVFVPTTPNPTSGFLIVTPKDEVLPLDVSVDVAVKMVISGGVIPLEFEGTRQIAPRQDAVKYCLEAMRRFESMTPEVLKRVMLELGMAGRDGFAVHNPDSRYRIKGLDGEFSGLAMVCMLYVAMQRMAPGTGFGVDVSIEYEEAKRLFNASG
jgi:uncharacterized membrane protein